MDLFNAIYHRRATRDFSDAAVSEAAVHELIRAANHAPSALNLQPWAFVVIHGRARLVGYSDRAKAHLLGSLDPSFGLDLRVDQYDNEKVNVFHGADTLILICAKPGPFQPAEDCCLAAQNLMLAAHGSGLSSCPVGFARAWFNRVDVKRELGIPSSYAVVLPIVLGYAAKIPPETARHEPEIASWFWDK